MATIETRRFRLTCDGKTHQGTIEAHVWQRSQAIARGMMFMGGAWLMALICVPIPLIHFVAVPGFVLAGPIVGRMVFKWYVGKVDLVAPDVNCPACGQPLRLRQSAEDWPDRGQCPSCQKRYSAELL